MDDEDDVFFKFLNGDRNVSSQCSEDCFEEVMNFFEDTAQAKQPFAAVDSPPVLTYEDMEGSFDENINERARVFAKDIYEYWKRRRLEVGNKSLITNLKVCHSPGSTHSSTYAALAGDRGRNRRRRSVRLFPEAGGSASSQDPREGCPECRETEEAQERARRRETDPGPCETKGNNQKGATNR